MAHRKVQDTDFRMWPVRGTDHESEFQLEHDGNDPTASPTTPLQLGSPIAGPNKRLGMYPRSQSMNGRIQKSNFVRSQSFGGGAKGAKASYRSHHSETLQAQLLNYMKATGMDQQKVVLVLERLKEMYATSREQQQQPSDHGSQVKWSPPRTSVHMDDPPVEASTIALLQQKFAQLEKYKESVQGQHIQLYPSSQTQQQPQLQQQAAPSSTIATPNGFYYSFDEAIAASAAAEARQQRVFLSLSRSSSAKSMGTTDDSWENSDGYPAQQQQPNNMSSGLKDTPPCSSWASDTGSSAGSSSCKSAAAAADNINALLHYMLQQKQQLPPPPTTPTNCNSIHQQNLTAFRKMDLSAGASLSVAAANEPISGVLGSAGNSTTHAPALGLGLGAAGKETSSNNISNSNFLFSTSPLHRAATLSTAAKQLSVDWGDGLSLLTRTPTLSPASSGGWESEASDAWRSSSSSDSIEERDLYTEPIDTSLHL